MCGGPFLLTVLRILNYVNSWTAWICHLPVRRCIYYRYFHIYRYVGKCILHTQACLAQKHNTTQGSLIHIYNEDDTCIVITPSLTSLLGNFWHWGPYEISLLSKGSGIPKEYWVVVRFLVPKRSQELFFCCCFLIQGYIKKQRLQLFYSKKRPWTTYDLTFTSPNWCHNNGA